MEQVTERSLNSRWNFDTFQDIFDRFDWCSDKIACPLEMESKSLTMLCCAIS